MNVNTVCISLERYDEIIEENNEYRKEYEEVRDKCIDLYDEKEKLEENLKEVSNELEKILDMLIRDDYALYEEVKSYDISCSMDIANFLNENSYFELLKAIKKRKKESRENNE